MKRKALNFLGRDAIARGLDSVDQNDSSQNISQDLSTPEQIAQRRLVRLRLPSEILAARMEALKTSSPKAAASSTLIEGQQKVDQNETAQNILPPPSFFNRPMTPVPASQPEAPAALNNKTSFGVQATTTGESINLENKPMEENKPQQSIFGGLMSKPIQQQATTTTTEDANKPKSNLFGSLAQTTTPTLGFGQVGENKPSTGIFGSLSQPAKQPEPTTPQPQITAQPTSSLFGGLSQKPPGTLFGQAAENKPSTAIFGALSQPTKEPEPSTPQPQAAVQPTTGIFGGLNQKPAGGLFGQTTENKPAIGIFGSLSQPAKQLESSTAQPQAAVQPTTGIFGGLNQKPAGGLFGQTTENKPSTGMFGGLTLKPVEQETPVVQKEEPKEEKEKPKTNLFGSTTQPTQQGFGFAQAGGDKPSTGLFAGLSQPTKQPEPSTTQTQAPTQAGSFGSLFPKPAGGLFGQTAENKPSTGIFGGLPQKPVTQETPVAQEKQKEEETAKPKANLFGSAAQTTAQQGFGFAQAGGDKPSTGLFAGLSQTTKQPEPSTTQTQAPTQLGSGSSGSLFQKPAGGLFGQAAENKPSTGIFGSLPQKPVVQETPVQKEEPKEEKEKPKGNLFGSFTQTPAQQGLGFGQAAENKPSTGIFGGLSQPAKQPEPSTTQTQAPTQPGSFSSLFQKPAGGLFGQTAENKPSGGIFGGLSQKPAAQETSASQIEEEKPKPIGLFGSQAQKSSPPQQQSNGAATEDANKLKLNMFAPSTQATAMQSEDTKPKGNLFGSLTQPKPQESTTTQAQTTEQPKPNLFGNLVSKPAQQGFGAVSEENKPKLGLFGSSSQTPSQSGLFGQSSENKPTTGIFGSLPKPQGFTAPKPEESNKPQETTVTPAKEEGFVAKPNLFHTLLHKSAEDVGLPAEKVEKEKPAEPEKKPLFGNLLGQKPAETTTTSAPSNLFGTGTKGLFGQTPAAAEQKKTETSENKGSTETKEAKDEKASPEKPAEAKPNPFAPGAPSMFAGGAKSSGLFAPSTGNKQLFANLASAPSATFTSILSTQTIKPSNLFSKPITTAAAEEGSEGEGEEEDEEPARTPSPEADLTKSKGNYQYQFDYDKIISKKVNKLKPGAKDMLLEGEISLNKNKDGKSYFMIYRNKAKLPQYQGQLIANVSKTEFLNPRQDALSVIAYSTDKGAEKPKPMKDNVKIMFVSPDDCIAFKRELDKALS